MKYIFILITIVSYFSQLSANQTMDTKEIIQRIEKYRTLPNHKAITAAIYDKHYRAIGFATGQKSIKSAKDLAYQKCNVDRKEKHISEQCKILALDDAVGCEEIKNLLKKQFEKTNKKL